VRDTESERERDRERERATGFAAHQTKTQPWRPAYMKEHLYMGFQ